MRRKRSSIAGVMLAAIAMSLVVSGVGQTRPGSASKQTQHDRFAPQLESLSPDDPMAYFKLAEEIADVAQSPEDLRLTRRLFGLAGALDPDRLGRSACLALADLEQSDSPERRRLMALASLLDERSGGGALYVPPRRESAPPSAALDLVQAFSYYRRGQGARARSLATEDNVLDLMSKHDALIPGGVDRFLEDCRLYRGEMQPNLSNRQLRNMLHLELALLAGEDRGWGTELAVTRGRPLIEVNPEQLAQTFGVDPERPLYRNGRWIAVRR